MSLIFDLDCMRKDNDKKCYIKFPNDKIYFAIKLRWFSITWTKWDIIHKFSDFKKDIKQVAKEIEVEIQNKPDKPNIGKLGRLKRIYKALDKLK